MPNVSSSLGSTQRYIPVVPSSQIGRYAGLFMHFPTLTALNNAVADELLNVGEASPLWTDNQPMAVAAEAALGVHRLWKTSLSHARTVVLGPGKTAVLPTNANTVIGTTGSPSGGTGADGDIAIDSATGIYYTKATGSWSNSGTTGQLTATDKSKLDGIASGATANSPDATLLNRSNHTGTQPFSTISDGAASVDARISSAVGVSVRAQAPAVSQAEAEAGVLTAVRDWTPQRVAQAIAALAPSGGGGGVTVQDEGTPLTTTATTINFVGAGVTATGSGATKTVTIPGPGAATISVKEDNVAVSSSISVLDFLGADFDVVESPAGEANINISAAIARVASTQPLDATLTALAGTAVAANTGIYATGVDAFSTYSLTAGGRALAGVAGNANTFPYFSAANTAALGALTAAGLAILDDADATAQRATLGLVIGTNVQAFDATLTSLAALGTTADRIAYTTGADTWAETPLTAAARTLLDDTTTGAMLTTLGAQPVDADLTAIAGLTPTNDDIIQRKAGAWTNRTLSQLQADLLTVPPVVVVEATTARTLSASDNGKVIRCTAASATVITVPVAFSGFSCTILRAGAGNVSVSASGTTINGNLTIDGQYRAATLVPTGVANTFDLIGATGDFTEDVQDIVAAQFAAGTHTNISFSYNDTTGAISATVTGGGGGGGDASTNTAVSVDSEMALFSGTTGKLLKRYAGTGLVKTAAGVVSAATQGTDYYAPGGTNVAIGDGGTGADDAAGARTNLGLVIGTNVQAYDAGLSSIAGLTTLADRGIYTTASDVYAVYTLTAGGRALAGSAGTANTFPYFSALNTISQASITAAGLAILDDVDAAAQRTTLGLTIGTNVQAFDATLTSLAALGTTADRLAYTTGVDTWAETPITAAARTVLDDTTVGAMLTTLGGQPLDSDLTAIAALAPANDDIIQRKAGAWTNRTLAQLYADLITVPPTVVVESTTARTLSAADNGKIIRCTNAGATVITVPTAFSGYTCTIVRAGAGTVTLSATGTTLNGGLTIDGQYRSLSILPTGTANTFDVMGAVGDFTEDVQDIVAAQLAAGTHTNISFSYNDTTGAISATVTGGGGGAVDSVFGRTGVVTAQANDYTFAQIGSKPTTLAGYGITDATASSHVGSGGTAHANATTSVAGFMSSTDKTKLDGIASSATNTPLSSTTPAALGTAAVGVGTTAARADHVHQAPTKTDIGLANVTNVAQAPLFFSVQAAKTGAYTLQASDARTVIPVNSASSVTITVNTGLGDGFSCMLVQMGSGVITLAGTSTRNGATVTTAQYEVLTLTPVATDSYICKAG